MVTLEGNPFTQFVFQIFIFCAILIIGYTCNFYYLAFLSSRRKENDSVIEVGEPTITIQLPIYNEKYVATRLVDAVCQQDYPKDKMRIMVLDDSDDDTVETMSNTVKKYQSLGFKARSFCRNNYLIWSHMDLIGGKSFFVKTNQNLINYLTNYQPI